MSEPIWIALEDCLYFHLQLLARYGGLEGVRDHALLESALARPLHVHHYSDAKLWDLAACYAHGIVKNHPFIDGNKRCGFFIGAFFLEINGMRVQAPEAEAVVFTVALAAGDISPEQYAAWLEANCVPATQDLPGE